jgi:hypothetical protein
MNPNSIPLPNGIPPTWNPPTPGVSGPSARQIPGASDWFTSSSSSSRPITSRADANTSTDYEGAAQLVIGKLVEPVEGATF